MKSGETFDSGDDRRVGNNTMRQQYRTLSEDEKAAMGRIKDMGEAFLEACAELGSSRELSLARTKSEEAVMWAVKHITR